MTSATSIDLDHENRKRRAAWKKRSSNYDRSIGFFERRFFGSDHRMWACDRATGETLEVAIGTGLNIPLYGDDIRLTGIDISPEMLEIAQARSAQATKAIELREGDAHDLPFDDASFDSVVCTYSLCNIPDPHQAVGEMKRVLKPGGRLILVDHVRSPMRVVFWIQKAIELFTKRAEGEHMTRRPLEQVTAHGFELVEKERLGKGAMVERLSAVKP